MPGGETQPIVESLSAFPSPLRLTVATLATQRRATARLKQLVGHIVAIATGLIAISLIACLMGAVVAKVPTPSSSLRAGFGDELFQHLKFHAPLEQRVALLVALLLVPAIVLGGKTLVHRFGTNQRFAIASALGCLALAAIFLASVLDESNHARGILWNLEPMFLLPTAICAGLILLVGMLPTFQRLPNYAVRAIDLFVVLWCVGLASYQLMLSRLDIATVVSQESIIAPMVDVFHGKTLAVDGHAEVGFFPHFLDPVFHQVGFSVASISATFAVLTLLTLLAIYYFLRCTVRQTALAALIFAAVLFSPFTSLNANFPHYDSFPLRAIFPALILAACAWHAHRPRWSTIIGIGLLSGVAVLWNFSSGLAALASALVYVGVSTWQAHPHGSDNAIMQKSAGPAVAQRLLLLVGVAMVAQAMFTAWLAFRGGRWPDLSRLYPLGDYFRTDGFQSQRLETLGPWLLLVAVYLVALLRGCSLLTGRASGSSSRTAPHLLQVAVLGSLQLADYLRDPTPAQLYFVAWPACVVLGLLLPSLLLRVRSFGLLQCDARLMAAQLASVGQLLVVVASLGSLFAATLVCNDRIGMTHPLKSLAKNQRAYQRSWQTRVRWVRESQRDNSKSSPVLVLSARDHLWHMHLGQAGLLPTAGFNQLRTEQEFNALHALIEQQRIDCVVWDESFLRTPIPETGFGVITTVEREQLQQSLNDHYEIAGRFSVLGEQLTTIYTLRRDDATIIAHNAHPPAFELHPGALASRKNNAHQQRSASNTTLPAGTRR